LRFHHLAKVFLNSYLKMGKLFIHT